MLLSMDSVMIAPQYDKDQGLFKRRWAQWTIVRVS
jgi:hypothetical protein